jgi:hypothetical protein
MRRRRNLGAIRMHGAAAVELVIPVLQTLVLPLLLLWLRQLEATATIPFADVELWRSGEVEGDNSQVKWQWRGEEDEL